jgi:hypothetical protein
MAECERQHSAKYLQLCCQLHNETNRQTDRQPDPALSRWKTDRQKDLRQAPRNRDHLLDKLFCFGAKLIARADLSTLVPPRVHDQPSQWRESRVIIGRLFCFYFYTLFLPNLSSPSLVACGETQTPWARCLCAVRMLVIHTPLQGMRDANLVVASMCKAWPILLLLRKSE